MLYQMKAEIIYFVSRGIKKRQFMRSLRINGFKIDALHIAVYFRCPICKGLIGYVTGGHALSVKV